MIVNVNVEILEQLMELPYEQVYNSCGCINYSIGEKNIENILKSINQWN